MRPYPDQSISRISLLEATFVAGVLSLSAQNGGSTPAVWLSAGAVFLSFLCAQIAFDLADFASTCSSQSTVGRRYRLLYLSKEIFWIVACVAMKNYPLIASTIVFASYPAWRKYGRKYLLTIDFSLQFPSLHCLPLLTKS